MKTGQENVGNLKKNKLRSDDHIKKFFGKMPKY